jgi:hypothetical protein
MARGWESKNVEDQMRAAALRERTLVHLDGELEST